MCTRTRFSTRSSLTDCRLGCSEQEQALGTGTRARSTCSSRLERCSSTPDHTARIAICPGIASCCRARSSGAPAQPNYHQTALHEFEYWTGHPDPLNRPTLTKGTEDRFGSHDHVRKSCGGDQPDDDGPPLERRGRSVAARVVRRELDPSVEDGLPRDLAGQQGCLGHERLPAGSGPRPRAAPRGTG